jgi:hypothetical protein
MNTHDLNPCLAATDEAGRVLPVGPTVKGAAPALHAQAALKTESSSGKKESADKNRPAPVQTREMGGPSAGLMVRPRDPLDVLS